jgi:sugar phosphate isomerase/epimerase
MLVMSSSPFTPGLVSITFRKLTPTQIVDLVRRAGVTGIEWGGDIHVPHGRVDIAKDVAKQTTDAGLKAAAYGSYYRAGGDENFRPIVDTAVALKTKVIRVWVGNQGSDQADAGFRGGVIDDCRQIAELAGAAGLTIACEWHGGTLTDTAASAQQVFDAVQHPAFKTYWQPRAKSTPESNLAEIDTALPRFVGVHVFQWNQQTADKEPLADGAAVWRKYLDKLTPAAHKAGGVYALIEFVKNEDPEQFLQDAAELKRWLLR